MKITPRQGRHLVAATHMRPSACMSCSPLASKTTKLTNLLSCSGHLLHYCCGIAVISYF